VRDCLPGRRPRVLTPGPYHRGRCTAPAGASAVGHAVSCAGSTGAVTGESSVPRAVIRHQADHGRLPPQRVLRRSALWLRRGRGTPMSGRLVHPDGLYRTCPITVDINLSSFRSSEPGEREPESGKLGPELDARLRGNDDNRHVVCHSFL